MNNLCAVIGYGSLLSPESASKTFDVSDKKFVPVSVRNFKRLFNVWTFKSNFAVLNIVPFEDEWFNGVLIFPLNNEELEKLKIREISYNKIEIPNNYLFDKYNTNISMPELPIYSFSGKEENIKTQIKTKKRYYDLCLNAAADYGEDFQTDYLETTFSSDGILTKDCSEQELFV